MAKDESDTGFIEEPVFARGFDPAANRWSRPPAKSPWARHFELGRQNPGKWMKVAEAKRGGCRHRLDVIQKDRRRIDVYLMRTVPLERWELRQLTLEGTWCDRELWIRYLHTLTPEEDAEDRRIRRLVWEQRRAVSNANKIRKAQEARDKAREAEAANQVRIRGRRRPGT